MLPDLQMPGRTPLIASSIRLRNIRLSHGHIVGASLDVRLHYEEGMYTLSDGVLRRNGGGWLLVLPGGIPQHAVESVLWHLTEQAGWGELPSSPHGG